MHLSATAFPFAVGPSTGWASKLPLPQEFPQRLCRWAWDVIFSLEHEGEMEKEGTKEWISCWRHELWWNCGNGHQKKATSICTSIVQSCVKKNVVKLKATFSAGNDNCHILPLKVLMLRLIARFLSWNFYWSFNHLCSWLFPFLLFLSLIKCLLSKVQDVQNGAARLLFSSGIISPLSCV